MSESYNDRPGGSQSERAEREEMFSFHPDILSEAGPLPRREDDLPYERGAARGDRFVVYDDWRTWPDAAAGLPNVVPPEHVSWLGEVFTFAERCHGDQLRPTGDPYTWHLLEALQILVQGPGVTDPDVLAAALLHDVVEDTGCTLEEVRERFGDRVAGLVDWLTKAGDEPQARDAYLRRLATAPAEVRQAKLADRLSNVQRLDRHPRPEKQRSYYAETVASVLPLAKDLPWFDRQFVAWRQHYAGLDETTTL